MKFCTVSAVMMCNAMRMPMGMGMLFAINFTVNPPVCADC